MKYSDIEMHSVGEGSNSFPFQSLSKHLQHAIKSVKRKITWISFRVQNDHSVSTVHLDTKLHFTVFTGSPLMETRDPFLPTTTVQDISDFTRPQLNIPETKKWKKKLTRDCRNKNTTSWKPF